MYEPSIKVIMSVLGSLIILGISNEFGILNTYSLTLFTITLPAVLLWGIICGLWKL